MEPLNDTEFNLLTWNIIQSYFRVYQTEAIVRYTTESMNDFLHRKLLQIIDGFNPIHIYDKHDQVKDIHEYQLTLHVRNPVLMEPRIHERDGSTSLMTPFDARQRHFTYASTLCVDVHVMASVYKDGQIETTEKTLYAVNIGKIPIMVKSNYCILKEPNYSRHGEECRLDPGGYMIINGSEKCIISQDRISENKTYVFLDTKGTVYSHIAEIRSVPQNTFGPPKLTSVKLSAKAHTLGYYIRVGMHHIRHDIPLFILFRALGITTDKDIVDHIVYDLSTPTGQLLAEQLRGSIDEAATITTPNAALDYMSRYLNITGYPREWLLNRDRRINIIHETLTKEFMPHVGDSYAKKALYLGYMVNKLLQCSLGIQPLDDRDSYINKRVDTPGVLVANLFRQYYGKLIRDMKTLIYREIKSGPWKATNQFINVVNANNIYKLMKSTTIESGMKYSLATGNWGIRSNKTKQGVAQVLNRLTYNATLSHLRRVNTPMEKTGKLVQPRKLHPTQFGIMCPAETPEGSSVGLVKNLAVMTHVTISVDTHLIRQLLADNGTRMYEELPSASATSTEALDATHTTAPLSLFARYTHIIVNGELVGVHENPAILYAVMKEAKRMGQIHVYTGIVWNVRERTMSFCTDGGRCVRPLYVVRDGRCPLTRDIVRGVTNGELGWNDLMSPVALTPAQREEYGLLDGGIIEYLDVEEANHAFIAMTPHALREAAPSDRVRYTHMEIHPALILGSIASTIPFPDHNQAPRNTYQCLWEEEPVLMEDGRWVPIKDVRVGDRVITFHPETMETTPSDVIHHYVRPTDKAIYDITTITGRQVRATYDHKIMTSDGWKTVEEMRDNPGAHKIAIYLEPNPADWTVTEDRVIIDQAIWCERLQALDIKPSLIERHYDALEKMGLLPLTTTSPHLPRLARMCGYLITDGCLNIYDKKHGGVTSQCQIDFGTLVDAQDYEADVKALGIDTVKILEGTRTFLGRTHHTFKVGHNGPLPPLFIVLGCGVGRKTENPHAPVPDWIMNGPDLVVREFLAGFQGGDGCKIKWDFNTSDAFVCGITAQQIHPDHEESLQTFMNQISALFTRMGIEHRMKREDIQENRVKIGVKVSDASENLMNVCSRIGYRYARTKLVTSGLGAEYLRWKLMHIGERVPAGRNDYKAKNWIPANLESRGPMLFVPLESINHVEQSVVISDITVSSDNHSFITRNCIAVSNCAMGKQAVGIHTLNFRDRMDTLANVLNYPQRPLTTTRMSELLHCNEMPSGVNVILAIATFTGYNQEDSVIMNQSAVDRGMFNSTYYRTYKETLIKNHGTGEEEIFYRPPMTQTKGLKPFNYDKLADDGFVPENTHVEDGDILIGKCMPQKAGETFLYKDNSIVVKHNENGYVDRNASHDRYFKNVNSEGYVFGKVRVRSNRIPVIGDKVASRSAQKGTIGMLYRQEDMPFSASGLVPDIIMNPHAIPSRMTIGQMIETIMGKACCSLGTYGDATPFNDLSVEDIARVLDGCGFERYGDEILYDPRTGAQMPTAIFVGPTYYQRLKHMTCDKIHSRSSNGPVVLMTRQPAEGRAREGGLRLGEMEVECNWAHGALHFLKERLMECSDNYRVFICNQCGMIATVNPEKRIYKCDPCKNYTSFQQIRIPYAAKLLFQEIQAMGIGTKFLTR